MVKKIAIFFAYTLFFFVALVYLVPKTSIYFYLEKKLEKFDLVISSEEVQDTGLALNLRDAEVSFKEIPSAEIKEIDIKLFALYNSINIKEITLSSTLKALTPLKIYSLRINHSIFNPLDIYIEGIGEFGEFESSINLLDSNFHLELHPSKLMLQSYKNTMRKLKKNQEGVFTYDKTF